MRLTDPSRGLVADSGVQFEADIQTLVHHAAPEPGVVYFYDDFFTSQDIRSTSVQYALGPQEKKLKTSLYKPSGTGGGTMPISKAKRLASVGLALPISKSEDLWRAIRDDAVVSPIYPFATPQINQTFPLSLSIGMALPTYDCWFSVCVHKSLQTSTGLDLSKNFVLDILPNNITDFVNWSQLGTQIDRDGDGLPTRVDPDDQKFDTDGDGLPDSTELNAGLTRARQMRILTGSLTPWNDATTPIHGAPTATAMD